MADEIVWEAPATNGRQAGQKRIWEIRLAPLKERPCEWARVAKTERVSQAYSAAGNLRSGMMAGVEPSDWEFVSQGDGNGAGLVFARFIGEAS